MHRLELLARVVDFIRAAGVEVIEGEMSRTTLVPGIDIRNGALVIEPGKMCQPADLLHEAAHIALTLPDRRAALDGTIEGTPADEMSAIAWTWAAARFLEIEPAEVFHEEVISGNGPTLCENFSAGRYVGVPMLQRWGLTFEPARAAGAGVPPYPHMVRWLRT